MEVFIFLTIAAFLFAVIGIITLLVRTSKQAELLREHGKRIALLENTSTEPPVIEASAGEPALAEAFPVPEPEAPERTASLTETFFPPETDAPAQAPAKIKNPLAAFIRGGNLWAAGGIILLIAAFAMLITYLASRGFFTVEMGIAGAAFSGLVMLAAGWRFRKKRPFISCWPSSFGNAGAGLCGSSPRGI
jgi:uncharacterized membrane protein